MECDDLRCKLPTQLYHHALDLDGALHEMGFLASNRPNVSPALTYHVNNRYVSSVSFGFLRPPTSLRKVHYHAYQPYTTATRRERIRTQSENNGDKHVDIYQSAIDTSIDLTDLCELKKAKSLESIVAENDASQLDLSRIQLPEVEVVSDSIQKLRVDE